MSLRVVADEPMEDEVDAAFEKKKGCAYEFLDHAGFKPCDAPTVLKDFPDVFVDSGGVEVSLYGSDNGSNGAGHFIFALPVTSESVAAFWSYSKEGGCEFFRYAGGFSKFDSLESVELRLRIALENGRRIMEYAKSHSNFDVVGEKNAAERFDGTPVGAGAYLGLAAAFFAGYEGIDEVTELFGVDFAEWFVKMVSLDNTPLALQELWLRFATAPAYMASGALVGLVASLVKLAVVRAAVEDKVGKE